MEKGSGIRTWAAEDQPRYKFAAKGKKSLSDVELLAILIASGNVQESALDLARRILTSHNNNLDTLAKLSVGDFVNQFKGIGEAKATKILAALELGNRRRNRETSKEFKITDSASAFTHLYPQLCDLDVEIFYVLYLNRANHIVKQKQMSQGGIHATVVDVRVILREALLSQATSIIISHNHPSGRLEPSAQDIALTKDLKNAAQTLDINLMDHLIIAGRNYYSFADQGKL